MEEAREIAEEARSKAEAEAEAEATRLEVERTSLLLETGRPRTRYPFSTPKPVTTRRLWRKITRRP